MQAIPSIIRAIIFFSSLASTACLASYGEAKSKKNQSKNNHKNLKITKEQIEIVEKALEKAKNIIKTQCPIEFKKESEKLPEIKKLNTFEEKKSKRYVVTTDDEPVNDLIRRLNR